MVVARKVQSKAPKAIEDDGEPLVVDLGFVGEPDRIDTTVIDTICAAGMIPVIAPIGVGEDGATYNINADTMAGCIAAALGASRLFLLTDVPGVLDKQKNLLTDLTPADIAELAQDGTISGGMIPSWKPASTRSRPGARRWSCSTARAARDAAGNLHLARRRHADPGVTGESRERNRRSCVPFHGALSHSPRSPCCWPPVVARRPRPNRATRTAMPSPSWHRKRCRPSPTPTAEITERGVPSASRDPAEVLTAWGKAVEMRDWETVRAYWGDKGARSGLDERAFAAKWSTLLDPRVTVGKGESEGAAGSLYYTAPSPSPTAREC
jgi:hypothetical protein